VVTCNGAVVSGFLRLASSSQECVNSQIIQCHDCPYSAYVVSGRDITFGDEIYVSYGRSYWRCTSPATGRNRRIYFVGT
jgi:hypothetical protein